MKNKLIRISASSSWFQLAILILSILDNTVLSTMTNNEVHHGTSRRINLPRAVATSRRFACKEPQSRAYNLKDLMQSVYQNPGESANQPVYIMLKRCDGHSGCCMSPDMSCTPIDTEKYYEDIEIEIWSLETNDTRRQWIRVEQHGRCTCEVTTINDRHKLEHENPAVFII